MEDSAQIKLRFGGEKNQIDALTLINNLNSFITIVEEINNEVNIEEHLEIKINGIEKGSFIINLDLIRQIHEATSLILNDTSISSISDLVGVIVGIYTIREFLKGKKPAKVEENSEVYKIQNNEGGNITINQNVYNIYDTNDSINEALNNQFESLAQDPNIQNFSIEDKDNRPFVVIPKESFDEISYQERDEKFQELEKTVTTRAVLIIFKVVFDSGYKWQFIFNQNKINANIDDTEFFKKIDSGKAAFHKGDALEVELEILKQWDKTIQMYINKSYTVKKVHKHIPRSIQGEMNL